METILGALAFALMMAGQLLAVIAAHNVRFGDEPRPDLGRDARTRHVWLFGS